MMNNPLALTSLHPMPRFLLNRLTHLNILSAWYDEWLAAPSQQAPSPQADVQTDGGHRFLNFVLEKLDADLHVTNPEQLSQIPATDPLLIVANHPLGAMEGMLLSRLLLRYRPDLRVLTNELLLVFPEFKDLFIGVDVLNPNAQSKNMKGMREANRHLGNGGALLIFPAGTVSHMRLPGGSIEDSPWSSMVGRLALKHDANCVSFRINGRNSTLFYLAGLIHKRLRTLLLPRAMLEKRGSQLQISVGKVIDNDAIKQLESPTCVTQYLRLNCDLLSDSISASDHLRTALPATQPDSNKGHALAAQFDALLPYKVAEHQNYAVYCAPFQALGCIAGQLALEREQTFRQSGEGTGKPLDQDQFDSDYWHILAWDHDAQRLIGGYRVVRAETAVKARGLDGLYSHTLFHFDEAFLRALGPAIELGRSFVTSAYQRNPRALDLLWKGIGAFVLQNSDCHTLFGCVSISQRYSPLARALLADTFLHNNVADEEMRKLVRPVARERRQRTHWDRELLLACADTAIFNKLLGSHDAESRVPTLIRHYLAMNGKFVDFSINNSFNRSLDGLIFVDLRNAPPKYLQRYLGKEPAERLQQLWRTGHAE
ncbi:MAG: GNAT family N-acyltransferase [Gammaproteobacteria bacterium]|nr:GNAT family N-acyltransferase [Gammaproteobacteria bacterium]